MGPLRVWAQLKQTRATTRAQTQHLDAGRGSGRGGATNTSTEAAGAGAVGTWGASGPRSGGIRSGGMRGGATSNGVAGPSHARSASGGGGAAALQVRSANSLYIIREHFSAGFPSHCECQGGAGRPSGAPSGAGRSSPPWPGQHGLYTPSQRVCFS